MRIKLQNKYVLNRDGVYYYVRRIPKDVGKFYPRNRLYFSLRTKSHTSACKAALSVTQKLDDYWLGIRLKNLMIPQLYAATDAINDTPKLSEALYHYLQLKGNGKSKAFVQTAERAVAYVTESLGDRPISAYSSSDAGIFRDWLTKRGLSADSVRRTFATVRPIINLCIREKGLDCTNAFANTFMPESEARPPRKPVPNEIILSVQKECREIDDDVRHLIALISDTGMRLSEAAGLMIEDIHLNEGIPHLSLRPHPHRRLKTKDSERDIPLVGASLWAAKRIVQTASNRFAFPRYANDELCSSNSASAALNKWLKLRAPTNCVVHSFRHSLRDRLRQVGCPIDVIDQIGGWAIASVGERYGNRERKAVMLRWMEEIILEK